MVVGLAVALGAGLLIGIERERRKGRGDDREAAGLRTFAIAALAGALAQALPVPGLVAAGAVLVAALVAIAYWKSRSRDPGLTTELALFATYLIGVQAMLWPALAAACGAGLAALLALRERLHHFATQLLSEQELHDGLLLAALALIVLPLLPAGPIAALGGIALRPLGALVLLIMALQAAGQVALRWLGPKAGVLAGGFASGFVSSTATIASLGSRARAEPASRALYAGGATASGAATWLQVLILSAALSPAGAWALAPVALGGAAGAALAAAVALRTGGGAAPAPPQTARSALRPREALMVALLLGGVAAGVGWARQRYGELGMEAGVAIAALADAHAPVASLASLHAGGTIDTGLLVRGVLLAVGVNTVSRCVVAAVAGGARYALRVGAGLSTSLAIAVAGYALVG